MTKNQVRKGVKYGLWALAGVLGLILFVVLLAGLLLQTPMVKKKLARVAGEQVSAMLNGEFSVGQVDGNFFSHLQLQDLTLISEGDTVARLDQLDLEYNLWALLDQRLEVQRVHLEKPYVFLEQQADSSWNVQYLMLPSEKPDEELVTTQEASPWMIVVNKLELEEGLVRMQALDSIIPREVKGLNLAATLSLSSAQQAVRLDNFSFQTIDPTLELKELAFDLKRDSSNIRLADFRLKTARNQLDAQANYQEQTQTEGTAALETAPLNIQEFAFFVPGFSLPANPVFKLEASMEGPVLIADLSLAERKQQIRLNLQAPNFGDFIFGDQKVDLQYVLNGELENIDLAHWMGDSTLDYRINGQLKVNGKGLDPKKAAISMQGTFQDLLVQSRPVDRLGIDASLNAGDLTAEVDGGGDFGALHLWADAKQVLADPTYQLKLETSKLNLASLMGNDTLQTDLNLTAQVEGKGIELNKAAVQVAISMGPSSLMELKLDTLLARVNYADENLQIDSLELKSQAVQLQAVGNYSLRSLSDLRLKGTFASLNEFAQWIPLDSLQTSGELQAHLQGTMDSLALDADLMLNETRYQTISLQQMGMQAQALLSKADTSFQADLLVQEVLVGELKLDSISMAVDGTLDSIGVRGWLGNETLQTELKAGLELGDILRIRLDDWMIAYYEQQMTLQEGPATLEIDSVSYRLDQLKMASGAADTSQYLLASGVIRLNGEEDFKLKIDRVAIAPWMALTGQELDVAGMFQADLAVSGTADAPVLDGNFEVQGAALNDYPLRELKGKMRYAASRFEVDSRIVPQDSGRIEAMGFVPLQLRLDSMAVQFNPKDSVDFQLLVEQFPLAILQSFRVTEDIRGELNGAVTVNGTVESPDPKGDLRLSNGAIKMPEYGVDYSELLFKLNFLRNQMVLDTLLVRSEDGTLTGTGTIDFNSDFYKGDISDSNIELLFNRFNPVNHKQFNFEVSGDARLGGVKDEVRFSSDLTIPQGEIYLPAIFNMMGRMTTPEMPRPILMRELEAMSRDRDTLGISTEELAPVDTFSFDYFDKLTGKARIKIPKNTWIKNEDMHIEISGDLEFVKNKEFFELFGAVEVVRGQYDLLGKTFMIDEGSIRFEGGEELTPNLDITAKYPFRNAQRVQQELSVRISGTPDDSAVAFSLDGSSVSEGDALSYILFGKSMNELTMDQQENVAGAGDIAGQAAASILSSQLTNFLGNKLDVDYIEVKSDGSFDNATVVVGKYITNDLFVSYEQRFGETDEKDMAKYEVKLEYELFRFLFFQLNNSSRDSGFDVIFKFDAK